MNAIAENIISIKKRIANACIKSNRSTDEVKLLLATKTVSASNIISAFKAGETLIGENKLQELQEKAEQLKVYPHETHFIGHLQSNKVKHVLKHVQCIQSVDRLSLAEKLQKRLEFEDRTMNVFLQVNTSNEASKFGVSPQNALDFALRVSRFDRIEIRGLMTIGLFSEEDFRVHKCFRLLKDIQHQVLEKGIPAHELSMGMSGDLEIAIEEGSTMVRVGTAIFGARSYPDSYYWNENK